MSDLKIFNRVGIIGRFKPINKRGILILETLGTISREVIVGIGSANKYNVRNPWTAEEVINMLDLNLEFNTSNGESPFYFGKIDDTNGDNKKWIENVRKVFGTLDAFISGNPYVTKLLDPYYKIIHPSKVIGELLDLAFDDHSTDIRRLMAQDDAAWQDYTTDSIAVYLYSRGLVERFQKEFGPATLALPDDDSSLTELEQERLRTLEE